MKAVGGGEEAVEVPEGLYDLAWGREAREAAPRGDHLQKAGDVGRSPWPRDAIDIARVTGGLGGRGPEGDVVGGEGDAPGEGPLTGGGDERAVATPGFEDQAGHERPPGSWFREDAVRPATSRGER